MSSVESGLVSWEVGENSGLTHGGVEPHEAHEGWVSLLQTTRRTMPELRIHVDVMQEHAWKRDSRDEPEQDED